MSAGKSNIQSQYGKLEQKKKKFVRVCTSVAAEQPLYMSSIASYSTDRSSADAPSTCAPASKHSLLNKSARLDAMQVPP